MGNTDAFDERRRANEEAYFENKKDELATQLRERAAQTAEGSEIAEDSSVGDEAILKSLHDLGFDRETITLLHVVPLIQVAWIDGGVSQRERDLIFEIAAMRGVDDGTPAWRQLADWLETRPSDDFFDESLDLVGVLARAGAEGPRAEDLVAYAVRVAEASGGILGFGNKVSESERALLAKIAAELVSDHGETAKQVADKI